MFSKNSDCLVRTGRLVACIQCDITANIKYTYE